MNKITAHEILYACEAEENRVSLVCMYIHARCLITNSLLIVLMLKEALKSKGEADVE